VVENIKRWLPQNPDKTVAVLCPIGWYGEKVADALHKAQLPLVELLKSSQSTRRVALIIEKVLIALANPKDPAPFIEVSRLVLKPENEENELNDDLVTLLAVIRKSSRMEEFYYPSPGKVWTDGLDLPQIPGEMIERLDNLRQKFIRWHLASSLPIDQLVLTIAQDLFTTPAELALAHKFALLLEFSARLHPEYVLPHFSSELADISSNIRKFNGFSDEELRFNPDDHKGEVFVSTYHKAKGLEWDRVYLMSVNNYDFPSAQEFDNYIGEKWFIMEDFNPHVEALDRLTGLITDNKVLIDAPPGTATRQARLDYASERLRLFFVGITRARQSLVITWNTGNRKNDPARVALPLEALYSYWSNRNETA